MNRLIDLIDYEETPRKGTGLLIEPYLISNER